MPKKLPLKFYNRETKVVAQDLLGKVLIHKVGRKKYFGVICETEAYCGPHDLASHACLDGPKGRRASRGKTERTAVMFGPAGHAYIYLIYGMYYCFNIVTEKNGYPAAVLIRGIVGADQCVRPHNPGKHMDLSIQNKLTNGPGKLCRYLKIDKTLNNKTVTGNTIWLEDHGFKPKKIKKLPRVGVDYAGEYRDKKWRYVASF